MIVKGYISISNHMLLCLLLLVSVRMLGSKASSIFQSLTLVKYSTASEMWHYVDIAKLKSYYYNTKTATISMIS